MKLPRWLRDAMLILAAVSLAAGAGHVIGWFVARILCGEG